MLRQIDIEPNHPTDLIRNISIIRSRLDDNWGAGIDVSPQRSCVAPMSIRVEACLMRRNSKGMVVSNWDGNTTGLVEVFDTYMGDMPDPGVWLMEHTAFEARAVFRNLTLENGARSRPFLRKSMCELFDPQT